MNSVQIRWMTRILVVGLILVIGSSAEAVRKRRGGGFTPASGYVSFGVVNRSIGGDDFSGDEAYILSDGYSIWAAAIPTMEGGTGFKGSIGFRGRAGALEFSGAYTSHSGEGLDLVDSVAWYRPYDNSFLTVGMDLLVYINSRSQIQPFVQLGLMYNVVTIENGSAMFGYDSWNDVLYLEDEGNATLRGFGWRIGGGVQTYLNSNFSLRATFLYRSSQLKRLKVVGSSEAVELDDIDGGLGAGGITLHAQAVIGFGKPAK